MTEEMMIKRWKLKTSSFDILLVLITLMLVKAEWLAGESPEVTNAIYSDDDRIHVYVGNDEIAHYFFGSSIKNNSFILEGIHKCLDNFQLITCVKMFLLSRIDDVMSLVEEPSVAQKDLNDLDGMFTFKLKNATENVPDERSYNLNLDDEIANKVRRIFRRRSLLVNLLPKIKIEIEPLPENSNCFLCLRYEIYQEETQLGKGDDTEGRKRKKGSGGMPMMMIVPPLIMLGLMPFTLASLKAMVMNAVMINMMALNGAIFMTIRNLVFGPRKGDNVKYVNYGYSKDRQTQSKRPVLIIHSPAAFVNQPPVDRRPSVPHVEKNHFSYHYGHTNSFHDYENQYYVTHKNNLKHKSENEHNGEGFQKRTDPKHLVGRFEATTELSSLPKGHKSEVKYHKTKQSEDE